MIKKHEDPFKLLKKPWPFKDRCDELGDLIYCLYTQEENGNGKNSAGCGDLMLEWAKSRFYSLLVKDHLPIFNNVWDILTAYGHTSEQNRYTYGDIDVSIWTEQVKDPNNMKVIVGKCHCSCADDNTHLYILDSLQSNFSTRLRCRTVWPKEINTKSGIEKFDHNIKYPSLNTYRKRNFNFSYNDCRDVGHVFTYEELFSKAGLDHPDWHENRIIHALKSLATHQQMLSDYEANKC